MADDEIIEYINKKKEYIENDYKIRYWTEYLFLNKQKQIYDDRVKLFEKKLAGRTSALKMKVFLNTNPFKKAKREGIKIFHLSNMSGFINTGENEYHYTKETVNSEDKSDNFLSAFEEIVKNKELVPSKSVIVLNQSKHHTVRCKRKSLALVTPNVKKLKVSAKGSKKITDFFTKSKPSSTGSKSSAECDKKETPPMFKYKVEEIIYKHRNGDKVQLLWVPENHSELDASEMSSIHFCSEVARLMNDNPNMSSNEAVAKTLEIFPTCVWIALFDRIKEFEEFFMDRNKDDDEEDEEFGNDEVDDDNEL